ncbi:MAG: hypothetical protein ACXVYM_06630 [Gaiellaceae bacterium]
MAQSAYAFSDQFSAVAVISVALMLNFVPSLSGNAVLIVILFAAGPEIRAPPPITLLPVGQVGLAVFGVTEELATTASTRSTSLSPAGPDGPDGPVAPVAPVSPFAPFGSCPAAKSTALSDRFLTLLETTALLFS